MAKSPCLVTRRVFTAGLGLAVTGWSPGAVARSNVPHTWTAAPLRRRVRPDASTEAELWAINGTVPGPTLRLTSGERLLLTLVNETPKPLSFHWHGIRGPNPMDGVGGLTQAPVPPGGSFDYAFTPPEPGTFLVRPCVIGGSAEPAERGLAALLVVAEPGLPAVDREFAVLVDDWHLAEDGALAPFGERGAEQGRLGNWLSVNGGAIPERVEIAPGARVRLRLANACNARAMRLRFEGLKAYVAAIDGQPTDTFEPLRASVPFPPGTRYDIVFDMPDEAGATGSVVAAIGQGVPLLTFAAAGERAAAPAAMRPLPPNKSLPPAIRLQNAVRKDLVIRAGEPGAGSAWAINGRPGSASTPLADVKKGQPVVLALKNETPLVQPFHLHGHVFRLLHPFDDGWEPYFLDTVQVPENRTVRIAFNADNPGKWLIASTVLERFDAGLWTWIQVG